MQANFKRHAARVVHYFEEATYWLGWSFFDERPHQRPQALVVGLLLGAVTALVGRSLSVYSRLVVAFATIGLVYLMLCMPLFGQKASDDGLRALSRAGAYLYYVAGVVVAELALLVVMDRSPVREGLAVVIVITTLANVITLNYAIHMWNVVVAAQKDIGKFLVRTPVLIVIGGTGNWIGEASIARVAVIGATILLVPSTIELLLTLLKTPRDYTHEDVAGQR